LKGRGPTALPHDARMKEKTLLRPRYRLSAGFSALVRLRFRRFCRDNLHFASFARIDNNWALDYHKVNLISLYN